MLGVLNKVFDMNKRDLKRLDKTAEKVEQLATEMEQLTDDQLTAKTEEFKERYIKGETLDELQTEAFAVVREASRRVLGMYPFRVQIVGAAALHEGNISEMKTGEKRKSCCVLAVSYFCISFYRLRNFDGRLFKYAIERCDTDCFGGGVDDESKRNV